MVLRADEIVVDNFAGGGGASEGIEQALERVCLHCGRALVPHSWEKPSRFAKREFCSVQCSNLALAAQRGVARRKSHSDERRCLYCGEVIPRLAKYSTERYRRRVFCNRTCAAKHLVATQPERVAPMPRRRQSSTRVVTCAPPCETVDAYLARGGTITRCEPLMANGAETLTKVRPNWRHHPHGSDYG